LFKLVFHKEVEEENMMSEDERLGVLDRIKTFAEEIKEYVNPEYHYARLILNYRKSKFIIKSK